ncbi:MAG: LLM class flavin-dependent oxidoreductase [Gammaproteobacteria bacterium]|jgi:alkanesulfonate monooxygenase SsuD/methylene tetrahydromethanopterin reductase-like flavin-dependent oxidoreductase (luciferase family)|nr:LLM class flavin-dependent oxidoreductase [Gammaproteobacteria bacterium]MBT7371520.1 LLM class flavin-dependent oxidoreductase [Gammaproteobacteria bacterium]
MSLRLGVHVGQQNMSMDTMRALWRKLDEKVDWISAWDHFYEAPPAGGTLDHFEAMATLGALAAETRKARLGVLVLYVGYRNPASIAKAAATLDHISGGRFELGLGAGWHEQEAIACGYDFPSVGTRLDMLDEASTIIRGMLTQDRTTFTGKHFSVDNVSNLPIPVQKRMPIWIGGLGEKKTLKLVAKHADGWNAAYTSVDNFSRLSGILDQWCEKQDRDPATLDRSINLTFNLGITQAEVDAERENLRAAWGPVAKRIESGALLCTPTEAVDRINAYREAGASMINIALRAPWNEAALDVYLEEVIPAARG